MPVFKVSYPIGAKDLISPVFKANLPVFKSFWKIQKLLAVNGEELIKFNTELKGQFKKL